MTRSSRQERESQLAEPHLEIERGELLALLAANGETEATAEEAAHLDRCGDCRTRLAARAVELQAMATAAAAMADEPFDDAALARQRKAILERLAERRDGGRVLAFPPREPRGARQDRPAVRWLAAAAAAGLFVGMLAGQRIHPVLSSPLFGLSHESAARIAPRPADVRRPSAAPADPVLVHAHDEVFLSEMETAVNNRGAAELRFLDSLTPKAASAQSRGRR